MTEQELEQAIHDYIELTYKARYIQCLKVTKLSDTLYQFTISIPSYMCPTTIFYEGSDSDFLAYICEELRTRNYMRVYFYRVHRLKIDEFPEPTPTASCLTIPTPETTIIIVQSFGTYTFPLTLS